jgi:hypothetical protein
MNNKYLKENFDPIVKSSKTKREICEKLGLHKNGGGILTVNKYIKLYNIDISHFEYKRKNNFLKINIENILIENSEYTSTNHLKNRLYEEGLKKRECELCGQDENWNGKHMSLILDHINGINNDNRLENLRIVCPNCNATLETHCKGNNKKIVPNYVKNLNKFSNCIECGIELKNKTKNNLCKKCYDIKQRKVQRPDLETLLKDVEMLGYEGSGRKYKVSGNNIKKWIKRYGENPPKIRKN